MYLKVKISRLIELKRSRKNYLARDLYSNWIKDNFKSGSNQGLRSHTKRHVFDILFMLIYAIDKLGKKAVDCQDALTLNERTI